MGYIVCELVGSCTVFSARVYVRVCVCMSRNLETKVEACVSKLCEARTAIKTYETVCVTCEG